MRVVICGSMSFASVMKEAERQLVGFGHTVLMPVEVDGVDYQSEAGSEERVAAKCGQDLMRKHYYKIENGDAVLVVNLTKRAVENYVGANTFAEVMFAHFLKKPIYFLHPLPDHPYIIEELQSIEATIINGDLTLIR